MQTAVAVGVCFVIGSVSLSIAQDLPTTTIRVVVPFAAGAASDTAARIVSDGMAARLGRSIIVENRTGAGGNIGMENVVRSAADGSTLMVADASSGMSVNEHIYRNMKFSPAKDLTGVALIGSTPHAVFISPQLPVKSLAELVAYARERKGELTYGSSGAGSPGHLNGGAFTKALGIEMIHVPYKESTQGITDLTVGRLNVWVGPLPAFLGHVKSGNLRVLAVATAERARDLPDVPTVNETGMLKYESYSAYLLVAPAGTPRQIVEKLSEAAMATLATKEVQDRLLRAGIEPKGGNFERANQLRSESSAKMKAAVKTIGGLQVN